MSESPRRHLLDAHVAECDECRANPVDTAALDRILASSTPVIDVARLSRHVLAAAAEELALRARPVDWRRLAAAVVGSLIPLPLVLALNALFLAVLHTLLTLVGLPTVADYAVVSYVFALLFVLGATFAAIPVLVERSAG